jgi:hypothetical protein
MTPSESIVARGSGRPFESQRHETAFACTCAMKTMLLSSHGKPDIQIDAHLGLGNFP